MTGDVRGAGDGARADPPAASEAGPRSARGTDDPPAVSLVIATRDRPSKLERSLRSIDRLERPAPSSLEVLVVDNGPSPRTRDVVDAFSAGGSSRFRYLVEADGGASRARNLGIEESRGDLVAFVDDDCVLAPSWLRAVLAEIGASPRPDVLGGRVELYDPADASVSVRTSETRETCSWADVFSSVAGCNFCVRRTVLAEIGVFDERLGPGTPLRSAEDADLVYRAHRAGMTVVYSPDPVVRHDHGRRTREEVARLQRRYVTGRGGFYCKHVLRGDPDALRLAYWEVRACLSAAAGSEGDRSTVLGPLEQLAWLARGAATWPAAALAGRRRGEPAAPRAPAAGGARRRDAVGDGTRT